MNDARGELVFIVAGDPGQRTGGYLYDAAIVDGLRARGRPVRVIGLDGIFPATDAVAATALDEALSGIAEGHTVVVDGLAMGGLPAVVEAHATRLTLVALIHHPLCDETGLADATAARLRSDEALAVAAVTSVVVTSQFTARRLTALGMHARQLSVIEPGVTRATVTAAREHGARRLLCVASVTPRKGHDVLVAALATLGDMDWQCECVGALDRDPAYVRSIEQDIRTAGLAERIRLRGSVDASELAGFYADCDLFVLASHYEGYGMVITEALAHGLPIVTTTGGALADTLPEGCGLAVPPGDVAALAAALRELIGDREARRQTRGAALAARDRLQGWPDAIDAFAHVLDAARARPRSSA